jgi:hypothetical protein
VALGESYVKSVAFIGGTRIGSPAISELQGTAFIVAVPSAVPDAAHYYVVTAAHVVRPCSSTFIRFVAPDGSIDDLPVHEWVYHATEDVAVTPLALEKPYDVFSGPIDRFVGAAEVERPPEPGDNVFFVGLVGQVPSMGDRNVPMVRGGVIGALYQDGIPMGLPDGNVIHVHGHLIDCRSFGGFSGSPCFVRYISGQGKTERLGLTYPVESTLLLGMIGGHFDLKSSVALPDQEAKVKVPAAAGIAVVYTAETIRELLDEEELMTARIEDDERAKREAAEREKDNAATPDSAQVTSSTGSRT